MLRAWRQARAKRKQVEIYNRGYDYAAGAILRGEASPIAIQAQMTLAFTKGSLRQFDYGMDAAVDKLVELGVVEDDRI